MTVKYQAAVYKYESESRIVGGFVIFHPVCELTPEIWKRIQLQFRMCPAVCGAGQSKTA